MDENIIKKDKLWIAKDFLGCLHQRQASIFLPITS